MNTSGNRLPHPYSGTKPSTVQERGFKIGDFSYNTGKLRGSECDGTGQISLDTQFLPDVDIVCPACEGSRYACDAHEITRPRSDTGGVPGTEGSGHSFQGSSKSMPARTPVVSHALSEGYA